MGRIIDRRRVMGGKLPYDAEIEYLESTGTQYIDTGVLPGIFPFAVKFNVPNYASAGSGNVMGARLSSGKKEFQVSGYQNGIVSVGVRNYIGVFKFNQICEVVYEGGISVFIDDINYDITVKDAFVSDSILLFGIRNNGIPTQLQAGKIYYCQLSNLRDFIPVRVGNVGYMYDKVSGQLFGNAGTGNFILGPDKN